MEAKTFTNFDMRISPEDLSRLEEHIAQHPDNIEYLDWAAFAFYCNGLLEKAVGAYRRLILIHPDNPSYHYYLGSALFKAGDLPSARLEWEKTIRIDVRGQFASRAQRKLDGSQTSGQA